MYDGERCCAHDGGDGARELEALSEPDPDPEPDPLPCPRFESEFVWLRGLLPLLLGPLESCGVESIAALRSLEYGW